MPLQLLLAPHLSPLLDHLAEGMARAPLPPRELEVIVVQSQGMRRWLTLQLADAFGCAGSLVLPFPATFVRDLEGRLAQDRSPRGDADPFAREVLAWRIDAFLRELPLDEVWRPLRTYLETGDERARFGLATQVAGRLDDYQMFRPDVLADWEEGRDDESRDAPHVRWQAELWRVLVAAAPDTLHLGERLRRTIDRLHGESFAPGLLPARVTVFGVSTLPPRFVDLLGALARHVPVTIYTASLDPAAPHPLARAFGTQSREFAEALRGAGAEVTQLDRRALATGVLGILQGELAGGSTGDSPVALEAGDDSLRVHDGHGELRQLEIVRDQLLDALAADPTLRPHDLLLLVPDAAEWAPLVDAVFGVAADEAPVVPYRVADRPLRRTQPGAEGFARLLSLEGRRLERSEVMGFLSHPLARAAAGFTEAEVETLDGLLSRANVRWGYDAGSREALGFHPYEDATWRTGLDRLLLGTIAGRLDDLVLGVLPEAGDTMGDPELLASLATWIDDLAAALTQWRDPRTLADWSATLLGAVDRFLRGTDAESTQALATVSTTLRRLVSIGEVAGHDGMVPFAVVRDWVEVQLDDEGFGSGFLQGGMTVAALKPMRSLPFRVIAVAGLDDGVFPRRDRRAAFDLLEHERRPGDRDLRGDDRQLFLDLLLAAGERLILTYSGRAVSDNSPRAPSVVIDELLDHLDRRTAGRSREALVVRHPLQPFALTYFTPGGDARLFSYSAAQARAARARITRARRPAGDAEVEPAFVDAELEPPVGDEGRFELSLRDLGECWRNPSRFYCTRVLRFSLDERDDALVDDDIFSPGKMEEGLIESRMVATALNLSRDPVREVQRLLADGSLPPLAIGRAWHGKLNEEVAEVLAKVPLEAPVATIPIKLSGDGWRLTGRVDGVRLGARYVVRPGKVRPEYWVRAWVEHLVLCAAREAGVVGAPEQTIVVGKDEQRVLGPVSNATRVLASLVVATRNAYRAPLPFFPQAAWAWRDVMYPWPKKSKRGGRSADLSSSEASAKAMAKARDAFLLESSRFSPIGGDHEDPYVALCFRGAAPMDERREEFVQLAHLVFGAWPSSDGAVP